MKKRSAEGFLLGREIGSTQDRVPLGFHVGQASTTGSGQNNLIRYAGDAPLITLAPTGAGKSSGPVISNILNHPGTVICLDVKGKIHAATAEHRKRIGQQVHVLDLRDGDHGPGSLNPFDIHRRLGTNIDSTCRAFASEIVQRTGMEREKFWNSWAETMVTAGLSYLWHHQPKDCRLSKLHDLYTADDTVYSIAVMLDTTNKMNRTTKAGWIPFLQLPERETRPCVMATTIEHLMLFESERVRRLTDSTTIDLDGLVAGKPMTIYITVPPYRLGAYSPLLRLWLTGLMHLIGTRETAPKHRTLMIVDEAGQLGRMDSLVTASTLMREYGLTLWTIWQNAAQLEIYGSQVRTLIDNAGVIQCFGLRNNRMAEEISALVGGISAHELLSMQSDEQMITVNGGKPQIVKQIRYYQEKWLAKSAGLAR